MMSLYEIDQAIMGCLDAETGEILDAELLDALSMEREKKLENVACWIKNLKAEAAALNAEKKALEAREKKAKDKAESLEKWLAEALQGEKLNTAKVAISYRKSQKLEVYSEDSAVAWCMGNNHFDLLTCPAPSVSRENMKKWMRESGETVPGAVLVDKNNLQIK